jgi:hypothetical protein
MSVYLGETGTVEIRRQGEPVVFTLEPADVDVTARRMSTEWGGPCPFITGDQVEIKTVDETEFELIQGVVDVDVTRWVHLDQVGGIRLYDSYVAAVNGGREDALALVEPLRDLEITMDVVNVNFSGVAQMRSWEITTSRDTVDLTLLGDEFRSSYDQGLISGQGQITAMWDYEWTKCKDNPDCAGAEYSNYFSQLVIRFKEGCKFIGRFVLYCGEESVWYEAECLVTNVGLNFAPGAIVQSSIQFVTTGEVQLKQGAIPSFLLQEIPVPSTFLLEQPPGSIELEADLD